MTKTLSAAFALALAILAASCSSSLGEVPFDVLAEGVVEPLPCAGPGDLRLVDRCAPHPLVGSVSALEVIDLLDETASAALGVERVWIGAITGVGIDRDGRNGETGLSGWSTSWVAGDPADPDMLVFDTTAGICRVQNRCGCVSGGTCPGFEASSIQGVQAPSVDSAAAILAAFPDDPADARYDVAWDGQSGQWTVSPAAAVVSADVHDQDVPLSEDVLQSADTTNE